MKTLLLCTLMLASCRKEAGASVSEPDMRRARGDNIASEIVYVRDSATKLCFAYGFVGYGYGEFAVGGPMLATVPCDVVAPYLLNPEITPEKPQ